MKTIINFLINICVYIFIVLSAILLCISLISKKDSDGAINIMGYQMRIVISPSMEKNDNTYSEIKNFQIKDLKVKTMVFIKKIQIDNQENYKSIKKGDVLTFKYTYDNKQETITHRVVDIYENQEKSGYIIKLQGDNRNNLDDVSIQVIDTSNINSTNYVIGKVTAKSYLLGLFVYSLKQPLGIVLLVIAPCLFIIVLEIIRIINYFNDAKKKKHENEIEDLKRKLACLENKIKEI